MKGLGTTFDVAEKKTGDLRKKIAKKRGPIKLINRGAYAQTLIKRGKISVSEPHLESEDLADDAVLDHYWKDLYKYSTHKK